MSRRIRKIKAHKAECKRNSVKTKKTFFGPPIEVKTIDPRKYTIAYPDTSDGGWSNTGTSDWTITTNTPTTGGWHTYNLPTNTTSDGYVYGEWTTTHTWDD